MYIFILEFDLVCVCVCVCVCAGMCPVHCNIILCICVCAWAADIALLNVYGGPREPLGDGPGIHP